MHMWAYMRGVHVAPRSWPHVRVRVARRGRVGLDGGLGRGLGAEDAARVEDGEGHLRAPLHARRREQHQLLARIARRHGPRLNELEIAGLVDDVWRVEAIVAQAGDGGL